VRDNSLRLMLMHDELVHDVGTPTKNQALRFTILGGNNRLDDRKQIIELLLAHGADIDNTLAERDVIPLMFATTPDMAEFLLSHGANREAKLPGAQLAQAFVCDDRVKARSACSRYSFPTISTFATYGLRANPVQWPAPPAPGIPQ
jgi:hypothetical protein